MHPESGDFAKEIALPKKLRLSEVSFDIFLNLADRMPRKKYIHVMARDGLFRYTPAATHGANCGQNSLLGRVQRRRLQLFPPKTKRLRIPLLLQRLPRPLG